MEDRLHMGDLHGPDLEVITITSAHLLVVRTQYTQSCLTGNKAGKCSLAVSQEKVRLLDNQLVVSHIESHQN